MKAFVALSLTALALLGNPSISAAQTTPTIPTPTCAWPYEITPIGLGNATYPDTNARYWFIPFDAQWQQMTITGAYPKARYFSLVAYDNFAPTTVSGELFDAQIEPDPGGVNPFATPGGQDGTYTVTITRNANTNQPNVVNMTAETGWVFYRVYVPNQGEAAMGGVPLPDITITDRSGRTEALAPCQTVNNFYDFLPVEETLFPPELQLVGGRPASGDHIWFAPPDNPPLRLLPNPHVKYMGGQPQFSYQKGRVIVIRGKMPGFPDTFNGKPITVVAPGFDSVQVRYWSLCQGDLAVPVPSVQCATDAFTPVDESGFYTIVISNDLVKPDWVPDGVTWLPWGDEMVVPKLMVNRNMLPADDFGHSVQDAVAAGCTFPFELPNIPDPDAVAQAGQCAQSVMADYYPEAVWCDQQRFISGGWQACFSAAGLQVGMAAGVTSNAAVNSRR